MKSYLFEVFTLSLDGEIYSFLKYVRLNEEQAIVENDRLITITEKGWCELGVDNIEDRCYYRFKLMTAIDRINVMSELDYRISELLSKRQQLEFSAEEASLLESYYIERIYNYISKDV